MKKRVNLKNRVSALVMSFFLASGLIAPTFSFEVKAEALPSVLESSATVADCVMSYYAMSGSAVANADWINVLYDSLGSNFGTIGDFAENSLMTYVDGVWQPTETLTQNIQNTSAYTQLGLDSVFNVSAEEVANGGGFVATTGAATLSGAVSCVATHGILPVLGGVTAAYWGGIALGTLIAHKLDLYGESAYNGAPITYRDFEENVLPAGNSYALFGVLSPALYAYRTSIYSSGRVFALGYKNQNGSISGSFYIQSNDSPVNYKIYSLDSNRVTSNSSTSTTNGISSGFYAFQLDSNRVNLCTPLKLFNNNTEVNNYIGGLRDGTEELYISSPDLIGEDGNLSANKNGNGYTMPDMKPQIDPQTQAGKPLSLQDWLQFANGVQNNNNSTSPVPNNTSLFQDILDAIKGILPTPGPTPDPSPGGETYPVPGPTPDPSPVPDPEYQPETKPQPQYTEKPTENETDITEGDPWTTPDLLDKFPFCIPRDVYRVFTKLDSGARAAPHIQWRFNPNNLIDYTFDIDFSDFDSVAQLLRTLELLGFIVALALATRTMILS